MKTIDLILKAIITVLIAIVIATLFVFMLGPLIL